MSTVSTWRMVQLLMENPKRKAVNVENNECICVLGGDNYTNKKYLCSKLELSTDDPFMRINVDHRWTIIEPQPEPVSFAEAFKAHKRTGEDERWIKSCVTGNKYFHFGELESKATDEEIDGQWMIVEG